MRKGERTGWLRVAVAVLVLGLAAWAANHPTAQTSTLAQAERLVDWGRLKQARSLLQTASNDAGNQSNAPLLAYLGHIEARFGNLQAARALTDKALKLDQACASCHLYRFEALARHAETLSQFRALLKLHAIKKQLQKAEQLDPHMGDVQWGWIRFDLAVPASLGGGSGDALKHAAVLSRIDPVDGHLARASIFTSQGKSQEALAEYRAAAQEYPNDPQALFALGKALYQQGDYSAAAGLLDRAWKLDPASAFYGAYHAADLVRLGQSQQAQAVLQTAQQQHPDSRLGDFLTAQALADTGQNFAWAKQLLARYLAVPPEPEQATAADARKLLASLSQSGS